MLIIKNIHTLAGIDESGRTRRQGKDMAETGILYDAYLKIDDGRIAGYGTMDNLVNDEGCEVTDAEGGCVLPAWCDSHTHIVYGGSREGEFVDKINGLSYAEIARRGGGILNSAELLHNMSEDELYRQAMCRVREIAAKGTGCVEIKSGYGLNIDDELKMLRVIRRISETCPLRVVPTFLGAHAVGRGYTKEEYVDEVVCEMIPEVGRERLADFIDVFCDDGFFTPADTVRILEAGEKWGMVPKIHADELAASGGVEAGVRCGALSVDHLESMDDREMAFLNGASTMPTVLPGTSFFLNMPYANARGMIDSGLGVAVASDYNPGSTPSGDMKFAVSLACIKMRLLPVEAINAATVNGAYAMGLSNEYGTIGMGKRANIIITSQIPSINYIPYAYTSPIVKKVLFEGKEWI
ncbi:imidazolonepropionase [Xylanibacter muris]|uniref:Imidazolonepropionase n=1 Tax=Xylanibacter muris TaxID=2736290 RepID=A0ABX2AMT0_9BACT|nr:imidazolonepropionase [Xylanibacter muris]NPD92319.1 imidazolonepropionase [Xylanibacter muris]